MTCPRWGDFQGHFEEVGSDIALMDGIKPRLVLICLKWCIYIYIFFTHEVYICSILYIYIIILLCNTLFVSETCVHRGLSYQMTAKTTVVGRKHCCIGFACPQALKSAFSWLYPDGVSKPSHFFVKTWEMLEFGVAHYLILLYSGFNHHL